MAIIEGTEGDDTLYNNPNLSGDALVGLGGSDTYVFSGEWGWDWIENWDEDDGFDVIRLDDVDPSKMTLRRSGNDLWLSNEAGTKSIGILEYYTSVEWRIDEIRFGDGTVWYVGGPRIKSNGAGSTASISVSENTKAVTTVRAEDMRALTYSIIGGADSSKFQIDAATGVLTFKTAPDFENPTDVGKNNVYDVIVQAENDIEVADHQTIAVTVTNLNEAPTITSNGGGSSASINVSENKTAVLTATATDPEKFAATWSIVGGADRALFQINTKTGALTFKSAPDFETAKDSGKNNFYDVTIKATDAGGLSDTQTVSVKVTNVNDAPVISSRNGSFSVAVAAENAKVATTGKAADADKDALTWSISGGVDKALFAIDAKTGVVSFKSAPDYETPKDSGWDNIYDLTIKVTDEHGLSDTEALAVVVTDVIGKTFAGTSKADSFTGTLETDVMTGSSGNDKLSAGGGKDKLTGGMGADKLYGGANADTFLFLSVKDSTVSSKGRDTIYDFDGKGGDRVDFSKIDAKSATTTNDAFSFIGTKDFSKKAGELRYDKKSSDTYLYGDTNGDGKSDFAIHFDDPLSLSKGYFLL